MEKTIYAGFWIRTLATLIDTIIVIGPMLMLLAFIYPHYFSYMIDPDAPLYRGPLDVVIQYVVPFFYTILFWKFKGATPAKMIVRIKIVNAETLLQPSVGALVGRYFAYFVCLITLGLGFLWIAWDKDKRGFHDKLSGTAVIYPARVE